MTIYHSYLNLPEGIIPFISHETTIFLWFSYGVPMVGILWTFPHPKKNTRRHRSRRVTVLSLSASSGRIDKAKPRWGTLRGRGVWWWHGMLEKKRLPSTVKKTRRNWDCFMIFMLFLVENRKIMEHFTLEWLLDSRFGSNLNNNDGKSYHHSRPEIQSHSEKMQQSWVENSWSMRVGSLPSDLIKHGMLENGPSISDVPINNI